MTIFILFHGWFESERRLGFFAGGERISARTGAANGHTGPPIARGLPMDIWFESSRMVQSLERYMVQFTGHFDGEVIKPDGQVEIPVNTPLRVTIEPAVKEETLAVDWNRLLELAAQCAIEGPDDLALLHDRYAHGKPTE